jgi:hypothetical protein
MGNKKKAKDASKKSPEKEELERLYLACGRASLKRA